MSRLDTIVDSFDGVHKPRTTLPARNTRAI